MLPHWTRGWTMVLEVYEMEGRALYEALPHQGYIFFSYLSYVEK